MHYVFHRHVKQPMQVAIPNPWDAIDEYRQDDISNPFNEEIRKLPANPHNYRYRISEGAQRMLENLPTPVSWRSASNSWRSGQEPARVPTTLIASISPMLNARRMLLSNESAGMILFTGSRYRVWPLRPLPHDVLFMFLQSHKLPLGEEPETREPECRTTKVAAFCRL